MSGRVVHFEIPFDDGDRARNFYKEAFGWQLQEMPEMSYTMVDDRPERRHRARPSPATSTAGCCRGETAAGARHRSSPSTSTSIDAALERIGELGGSTVVREAAGRRHGLHRLRQGPRGQRPRPLGDRATDDRRPARSTARHAVPPRREPATDTSGTVRGRRGRLALPGMAATGFHTADELNALLPGTLPGAARASSSTRHEPGRLTAHLDVRPELLAPNGYLHAATVVGARRHRVRAGHPRAAARGLQRLHHDRAEEQLPRHGARGPDRGASRPTCTPAGRRRSGTPS